MIKRNISPTTLHKGPGHSDLHIIDFLPISEGKLLAWDFLYLRFWWIFIRIQVENYMLLC